MTGQRFAFEPFASLDGVLRGDPIRIMPVGTFYRGERKLDITEERLKAIAANFKAGLPRFRVPINENHAGVGKVGTVGGVEYMPIGNDGPGLYATQYELTDAGRALVTSKRFDATSPEMIWSLFDGAKYQDPKTGQYHDNVLVGLALTDKPYFGHDNVALFSAEGGAMADGGDMPVMQRMKKKAQALMEQMMALFSDAPSEAANDAQRTESFKDYPAETRREFAQKGWALPDGSYPIADTGDLEDAIRAVGRGTANPKATIKNHIIKRARALGALDAIPETWKENMSEEAAMADEKKPEVVTPIPPVQPVKTDTFTVKAEEFAALKAKADQVDALSEKFKALEAQANAATAKADKFALDLAKEKHDRRHDQLIEKFDALLGIPEKAETLADKVLALEEKDADLAKFFSELIEKADKALVESELFSQKGSARPAGTETFEAAVDAALKEQFKGDMAHYGDAMEIVQRTRPELAREYLNRGRR